MTHSKYILAILLGLLLSTTVSAQDPGVTWSSNVTLLCKTDYGRGPEKGRDVWGWEDSQTGKHYASFILNKNLGIADTISNLEPAYRACCRRELQQPVIPVCQPFLVDKTGIS